MKGAMGTVALIAGLLAFNGLSYALDWGIVIW